MTLTSVTLDSFKAFEKQALACGPFTLLSGLNGAGKSTVIQALAMLRQSFDAGFLADGQWLLNGELVELGSGADVLNEDAAGDTLSIVLWSGDHGNGVSEFRSAVEYNRSADVLRSTSDPAPEPPLDINLFQVGFQYLRADRINPAVTFPKSRHAVEARRFLGARGEYTAHFLLEYGSTDIACDSLLHPDEPQARSLLAQVNAWMQTFSPGVRLDVSNVPMTDLVRLEFAYRRGAASSGNRFRATNVGFGLTYSLPIIVGVLAARPGTLMLIENPEAHLHPQGQLAMGDLLARAANAGVQVIVETHSDHVLNGIRLAVKKERLRNDAAQLHFFTRDAGSRIEVHSPSIDEHGLLSEWPPGFFTQWDDTVLELLS